MTAVATPTRSRALALADQPQQTFAPQISTAPVVAAVDGSAASTAALDTAVRLAAEINAPLVFVYVRRGPAGFFGAPVYQRRLTKEMARGRRALDRALAVADSAGVPAEGEILEGSPRRRISEFACDRARGSSSSARAGASWGRASRQACYAPRNGRSSSLAPCRDRRQPRSGPIVDR